MTIAAYLDGLPTAEARAELERCCGASRWVNGMLERRPFGDDDRLFEAARDVWGACEPSDVLEALEHHPRIGANLEALREKFAATAGWSAGEQRAVESADDSTLIALRDGNREYEAKFGHIFVVCATGKTAAQMLGLLRARLPNEPDIELSIAASEQAKITRLRLEKLVP